MSPISDASISKTLQNIFQRGAHFIPDEFTGTGAPGNYLEFLFGVDGGNQDMPDTGNWELKFHGGKSLMTLFHLQSAPRGSLRGLVDDFGWLDAKGRTSFRHTIRGGREPSIHGFYVVNEDSKIIVRNINSQTGPVPYWTHDALINRFASKFRKLIVVSGEKNGREILFNHADLFQEPQTTRFIRAIEEGLVAIDFDARTTDGSGLRDHGTKFRINYSDLPFLYHHQRRIP